MSRTLHINVANKVATYMIRDGEVVCGNNDYTVAFSFDSEWVGATGLTARFIWAGNVQDVPLTNNACTLPMLNNATECRVGVYASEMRTTTAAVIPCRLSILCGEGSTPTPPTWAGFHLDFNDASYTLGIVDAWGRPAHNESKKVTLPFDGINQDIEDLQAGANVTAGRVNLLYTLLEATIITVTSVEDTYSARVTAGGLPVVDSAPTTVHKICGATSPSVNLLQLPDKTGTSNGLTYVCSATAGTIHIAGGLTEGATYSSFTVTQFRLQAGTYTLYAPHKVDKVGWIVRDAQNVKVDEILWNGTDTAKSFTVNADGNYDLYIYVNASLTATLDYTETPMLLRGDVTANLPAFSPYYAGVKSAGFKGIVSTGRNLLHFDTSDSARLYIDLSNPLFRVGNGVKILADRKMMVVKVFRYQGSQDWGEAIFGADFSATPVASRTFTVKNDPNLAYKYIFQIKFEDSAGYWATREEVLNANLMLVPSDSTLTIDDYTPYRADTSFTLASPVTLGRWDYLDADGQNAVYQTAAVDFSEAVLSGENGQGRKYFKITPDQAVGTDFSADALITNVRFTEWYWEKESDENAYIGWDGNYYFLTLMIPASYGENVSGWLADNPQVYATYKLRTPATTQAASVPHTYQAWHGGCEYMTSDADGAQNPANLELTVTQDYYEEVSA